MLLAHGAGAPMDSDWMNRLASLFASGGMRVARFEFSYMAGRRNGEGTKPPPRAEKVMANYVAAIEDLGPTKGSLIIGGKSMGGRVASMIAEEAFAAKRVAALLCLGYPFHPSGKPEQLRTTHLKDLRVPTLICQGTRDPLGTREDVANYALSPAIEMMWLEDGDHDLKPRKSISGFSLADHMSSVAEGVARWAQRIG